jgi:hypothetical protein
LEETVMGNNFEEDKIDCRNFRYFGSKRRPAVALPVEDDMMVVVVVVVIKVLEWFEFGDVRG